MSSNPNGTASSLNRRHFLTTVAGAGVATAAARAQERDWSGKNPTR